MRENQAFRVADEMFYCKTIVYKKKSKASLHLQDGSVEILLRKET